MYFISCDPFFRICLLQIVFVSLNHIFVYNSSRFSVIFSLFLSFGRKTRICVFPLWLLLVARGTIAEGLAFPISYNILEALFVGSPGENILLFLSVWRTFKLSKQAIEKKGKDKRSVKSKCRKVCLQNRFRKGLASYHSFYSKSLSIFYAVRTMYVLTSPH